MNEPTIHPAHRGVPLPEALRTGSYPWRTATGPIKYYLKARMGRGSYDAGLLEAIQRTVQTMRHCYPRRNDVIWATVQRAGHNWVSLIYTLVVEALYHQRELDIENIAPYRAGVYRHIPIRYDLGDHQTRFYYHLPIPRLMHTHDPFYPWMATRKVLLQIRKPGDVLISKYAHGGFYPATPFKAYLSSLTVRNVLDFYNTWGGALQGGSLKAVHCLRYEHLKSDPLAAVREVLAFFGLEAVPDACIQAALDKTQPEHIAQLEQQGRGLGDARLSQNIKSTRKEAIASLTQADYDALEALVRQRVSYNFGY